MNNPYSNRNGYDFVEQTAPLWYLQVTLHVNCVIWVPFAAVRPRSAVLTLWWPTCCYSSSWRLFVTVWRCDDTCNSLVLSLYCSPLSFSGTPSMKLHCTPSLSRGCRVVRWAEGELWVSWASTYILRCLASRDKWGVAKFYSVVVEMGSF
jgi:hypothetical protein